MDRSSLSESSNKVTVECIDPSELFATFESLLSDYLPLRNLHWKSTSRPLRSIDTLHVDLVPIKDAGEEVLPAPERRHQIPGLRQTPYLKIYLLRCDDNETYKTKCRKQIKDWVKSTAVPRETKKGTNNQENHDACDWLIVHIVLADTPAATQIRSARESHLGTTDSSDSISIQPRFLGKSPSTLLEKLRADFSSSKSGIDHVGQLCLPKVNQQPSGDLIDQIHDLIEKIELAILKSFDLRVQQYEEDIRERDSRRGLPGWNFNTFFILKEGLARGFENVGLFEDALAGYDELALGLETIVREQLGGEGAGHGGTLAHFSDELRDKIHACLKDEDDSTRATDLPEVDEDSDPASRLQRKDYSLDASKRPFRELILANEISIFDFRIYIISRQLELLLRSACAFSMVGVSSRPQSYRSRNREQFLPLSEVCKRAMEFITNAARTLRHDLELMLEMNQSMSTEELDFRTSAISNFVLSWMYVAALQVLAQTRSLELILPPPEDLPSRTTTGNVIASNRMSMSQRSSASSPRTASPISMNGPRSGTPRVKVAKTGAEELAGARAELYLLARGVVERIGTHRGWLTHGYAMDLLLTSISRSGQLHSMPLVDQTIGGSTKGRSRPVINGLQYLDLRSVFCSQKAFKTIFGSLTVFSYRHFVAANRIKSAEKLLGEVAILKFDAGDYEVAASHLSRIGFFYSESQWDPLGATFLELYAKCLKELDRHGEYVTTLIRLLRRTDAIKQAGIASATEGHLGDLWTYSDKLATPFHTPLDDFFSITRLTPYIRHFEDRDGFCIPFEICFHLGSLDVAEGLELTLNSMHDSSMPAITLLTGPISLNRVPQKVEAKCHVNVSGWYSMDRMQIKVGNLVFSQDCKSMGLTAASDDHPRVSSHAPPRFFVYPPGRSLQTIASPAPYLHLAKPRSIFIEMKAGWNKMERCSLSLRPATPGLRLRLHDAEIDSSDDPEASSRADSRDGVPVISFSNCAPDSSHKVVIPYTAENADVPVINARLRLEYSTPNGTFVHSKFIAVNAILPISVNVQDIFEQTSLVSRFTISPATLVPLRLWGCEMEDAEDHFLVESHLGAQDTMDVFPKQPASLVYRFTRREGVNRSGSEKTSLGLSVRFSCLDEVALNTIEQRFVSFLTHTPIANLVQPLLSHLLTTLRSQWSVHDFETIGLLHEIDLRPFGDLNWDAVLAGLEIDTRRLAKTWLKTWHNEEAAVPIYEKANKVADVPSRLIVIPVDLPTPAVIVTVCLEFDLKHSGAVLIGEALSVELQLLYTRGWSNHLEEEKIPLELSFEVVASPENWLIGGARKGHFLSQSGTAEQPAHSVSIIIVPQRTGHLLLPSIDVQCHKAVQHISAGTTPTADDVIPCEVNNHSLSKSLYVVRGRWESVVDIAIEAEAYGHVDSEKRSSLVDGKAREATCYAGVR